jgi:hypothetical protein
MRIALREMSVSDLTAVRGMACQPVAIQPRTSTSPVDHQAADLQPPVAFRICTGCGQVLGHVRVRSKIALQTRISPLEGDRTTRGSGDRPRPELAMVDSRVGYPEETTFEARGGIPKTPTRLETTLENNTRETTMTSAVSSSSFPPREISLDRKVSELVAEAYQVFDGALPIESTVEQWALVAQESRDAAGEELGQEAFAGYCQLAARTTASSSSVRCPGSRVKCFLGTLDRMLQEWPPLDRRLSLDADDYFGSAYAYLYR